MATTAELGRRLALAALGVLLVAGITQLAAPGARADESTKVLLVLDVSGSMNEQISSGGSKFSAAKKALKQVAGALPSGTQVGLRVYGSEIAEPKSQNPKACTDTQLVLPIGPLDRSRMNRAVDSFTAKGETPIAYSLGQAVDDLGPSGKRVLILVSDGEESCSGDPCPVARKLAKSGVDLQFNAIGLEVNAKARKQLQCIADAGDGSYLDAGDTTALQDAIRKLTQRALRPFEVSGKPVRGTLDPDDAPVIGVGQYRDRYDTSNKPRYYTINRTPGSIVTASVGTVVKPFRDITVDNWLLQLTTLDGKVCAKTGTSSLTFRVTTGFGGAVRSSYAPGQDTPPAPGCASDPQLRWSLARASAMKASNGVPVELLVTEEPKVANLDALPESLADYDGAAAKTVAAREPVRAVVGGSAYSNAPRIGAGTWTDAAAVGETVVYRVPLDYGQRLRVTATVPDGRQDAGLTSGEAVTTHVNLMSPARLRLTTAYESAALDSPARVTVASPQVRVRNRETPLPITANSADDWSTASVAGDYFVAVQLDPIQRYLTGRVMSLRLDVAVDGRPTGRPVHAAAGPTATPSRTPSASASPADPTPTPGPAPTSSTTDAAPDPGASSGPGTFLRGLGSGLGVAVVIGAAVWAVRRRRRTRP